MIERMHRSEEEDRLERSKQADGRTFPAPDDSIARRRTKSKRGQRANGACTRANFREATVKKGPVFKGLRVCTVINGACIAAASRPQSDEK